MSAGAGGVAGAAGNPVGNPTGNSRNPTPQSAPRNPALPNPTPPVRVVLVDDQRLVRSGFAMILSVAEGIEVVGEAEDGAQALELVRQLRPDVVLMDVQMPVLDGIEATRQIVAADLASVVILTTFDRDDYLFAGLDAGASGFLLKNAEPEQLVEAVRIVAHGHALLAPEVTRRVIQARTSARSSAGGPARDLPGYAATARSGAGAAYANEAALHGDAPDAEPIAAARAQGLRLLTEREREVLGLVARGMSNAEIAAELFVGEATVKSHVSACLAKLQVRDRIQAVVFAYEAGLVG